MLYVLTTEGAPRIHGALHPSWFSRAVGKVSHILQNSRVNAISPAERRILSMSSWSIMHQELAGKRRRMGQLLVRLKLFEWRRRQASNSMVKHECHGLKMMKMSKCHHLLVRARDGVARKS
jgi:hypothetical protein